MYTNTLLKMTLGLSIFTGIITAIFILAALKFPQGNTHLKISTTPSPIVSATPTPIFCGGIAGKRCPAGFICKLSGNYPDAGGNCVEDENQVVCTQDTKQCPDGSWVGRKGPNCEFAPCSKPN